MDTMLRIKCQKCLTEGKNYFPQPAGCFLATTHCRMQLALFEWLSLPGPIHDLFCKNAFCPGCIKPVLLHGTLFPTRCKT